ncbi:hypothetical protein FS837_012795 [Tulasnella sp. UAMH 9824]|nr:hypothetical protein FS837_012795 [Tulasnella sp. UAMH 9824]
MADHSTANDAPVPSGSTKPEPTKGGGAPVKTNENDGAKVPDPIVQIYQKLNQMFGNKEAQIFTMEYPGRILDMGNYSYKESTGLEAQVTKPQAVVEAEFRLSDDLFSLGQITGGPNGEKLSQVYQKILSSLVPSVQDESTFDQKIAPDQTLISKWLLELVPNWISPDEDPLKDVPESWAAFIPKQKVETGKPYTPPERMIPRVDLFQRLLTAYEDARLRWQQLKLNARPQKPADDPEWDFYDRMLATLSPSVDAKLEALWSVVLVRGQYHRIRHYLSLLDIESAAEALLRAKEALRASKMRSIDDSEDILPVQFSPASWGNYLTTDFEPVDLLMDQDAIIQYVIAAQNQRNELVRRLSILQSSKQDTKTLEKEVNAAKDKLTKAKEEMLKGFTENLATVVKFYIEKTKKPTDFKGEDLTTFVTKSKLNITPEEINQVSAGLNNVITQRDGYDAALDKYSRLLGEAASAEASNPEVAISQLKAQIEALSASISTHSSILEAVRDPNAKSTGTDAIPPSPKKGASQWQSLIIRYEMGTKNDTSKELQSTSTVQAHASGWFWSASYSQDKTRADNLKQFDASNTSISLAMNVMKVQISRPWLDASIFHQSDAYVRISGDKFSNGFDSKHVSSQNEDPLTGAALLKKFSEAEQTILPAYPVAFIVAKDVTIKLTTDKEKTKIENSVIREHVNAGGSCFGISVAATGQSTSSTQSAYSSTEGNAVTIKVPGPQIVGWIMQCTPEDRCSTDYHRIDPEQFKVGDDASADAGKNGKDKK